MIPTGGWAIVAKVDAARWAVFTASTASTLSASEITSALGATAVQNATSADLLDGYHASSFVRTVGGAWPDGSGNVATSGFSVNYANTADYANSAGNVYMLNGYHSWDLPYAPSSHSHSGVYAPMTAVVSISNYVSEYVGGTAYYRCTATRADGSTFTFDTFSQPSGG